MSTQAHNSYEALQCPNARPSGPTLPRSFFPRKLALKNIVPSQLAKGTVLAPSPRRLFQRGLHQFIATVVIFRKIVATA